MDDRLHVLGIRHHGPGSARSVLDALAALDPAIVLIEGPADAADVLQYATAIGMQPPVALLVHAADSPAKSAFYPFAEFSPEWQALRWALTNGRTVRFIDLPAAMRLAEAPPEPGADEGAEQPPPPPEEPRLHRDPLDVLAAAAGESDGEAWWNAMVEQGAHSRDVFPAIAAAMTAVREQLEAEQGPMGPWEMRREAHMRLAIRDALKETDKAIVVVCGAWHVPALQASRPMKDDRELLKSQPRIKTVATWVPWTDTRLAVLSGYGAGVVSPGWYRHLWQTRETSGTEPTALAAGWQAKVAAFLRDEGLQAATASAIEATRLALGLAAVRGYPTPGLMEMRDASLAALCRGEPALLQLIETRLVIGTAIGAVDEGVPRPPLLADFESWLRKVRLKLSGEPQEVALDLRSEAGLLKSTLFNRLQLIAVPWARLLEADAGRGTFRERWLLNWQPELNVRLAEALRWGATVETASSAAAIEAGAGAANVADLSGLVEKCLHADLPVAAAQLTQRLQTMAAGSADIAGLMRAVAPLANVLRYGTARRIPLDELRLLVGSMATEVCVGLQHACRGLDREANAAMRAAMRVFDGAVTLLDETKFRDEWVAALQVLIHDEQVGAIVRGYATRVLHDKSMFEPGALAVHISQALSPAVGSADAADWLEGLLADAPQLLLYDAQLLAVVDDWLLGVGEEDFVNLLPGLRRALGSLDRMERRRLLTQIRSGAAAGGTSAGVEAGGDPRAEAAFAAALPLLNLILGRGGDGQ